VLSRSIKVGDKVEITKRNGADLPAAFNSRIEALVDSRELIVQVPVFDGRLIRLETSGTYYFLVFTERGVYGFDTKIINYIKRDGFLMMQIEFLTEGEKVQRREYVRFGPCMLPMHFSVVNMDDLEAKGQQMQGIVRDISGGGCRFISNDSVEVNSEVSCLVALNEEILVAVGKILSKQEFEKYAFKYQYRLMFTGILAKERQKILQFIFDEQRKVISHVGGRERDGR